MLAVAQIAIVTAIIQTDATWNRPKSESVKILLLTDAVPMKTSKKVPMSSASISRPRFLFHDNDLEEGDGTDESTETDASPPRKLKISGENFP